MKTTVSFLLFLLMFAAFSVSECEQSKWAVVKMRPARLSNDSYLSHVLKPRIIAGNELILPGKDGKGFAIERTLDKVYIDKDQKGKADFVAVSGNKTFPFDVTLYYENDEKVKHTYRIYVENGALTYVRASMMTGTIEGTKISMLDDNNNGYFSESGSDGIYLGNSVFGAPWGTILLLDGNLYDVRSTNSGSTIEYRPFTGDYGTVDVNSRWCGSVKPSLVVLKETSMFVGRFVSLYQGQEARVPVGRYNFLCAYLPEVYINAEVSLLRCEVKSGGIEAIEWGRGLRIEVENSYSAATNFFTVKPDVKIIGASGEVYRGPFYYKNGFKIVLQPKTKEGTPTGAPTDWTQKPVNVNPMQVEIMWADLTISPPEDASLIEMTCEIPGVGPAKAEFRLKK